MLDFLKDRNKAKFTSDFSRIEPFTSEFFEERKLELKSRVDSDRFRHTLGVVETAQILAETYEVDVKKARLAALLHD